MKNCKEALLDVGSASNPSLISEQTHLLTQFISAAEESVVDMEHKLELDESKVFQAHVESGKSAHAAKELAKRNFVQERADINRVNRLVASAWKVVSECQSRVKHLIAEANGQI